MTFWAKWSITTVEDTYGQVVPFFTIPTIKIWDTSYSGGVIEYPHHLASLWYFDAFRFMDMRIEKHGRDR